MKRRSLKEIQQEDEMINHESLETKEKDEIGNNISEILSGKSDNRINKSDFEKLSITLPPQLFDAVEELSRTRRRQREPFTYSAIVREALAQYLVNLK